MAIFGTKNKQGNTVTNLAMHEGIPTIGMNMPVCLTLFDDHLEIKQRIFKNAPATLKYTQITNIDKVTETEIIEKSKSTLGRAAVGGLLLGPLGAIIGGMSGTGSKKKTTVKTYLVINYTSSSDEIKVITFEVVGATFGLKEFINEAKEKSGIISEEIKLIDKSTPIEL